ncbi:hypothetical protein Tco_0375495 [Tanacetum coccineum]
MHAKPKLVRDSTYTRKRCCCVNKQRKVFNYKQKQTNWLADTMRKIDNRFGSTLHYIPKFKRFLMQTSGTDAEPLEQVDTCDSNVIPDSTGSSDMCDNDIQTNQNAVECDDERVSLANLKLNVDENKKIQNQLKKANTSLAHELKECKSILAKTSRTLGESNSILDSCLIALQNKQTELETYKTLNDRTFDYDKLEHKLNETLGLLAQKEIDVKKGLVKEKTKVITDLKLKEEKDIDKMISMEKQLKFLNEIVYKRNQTIHMLTPKGPTFNGRPTFANPMYLKHAQSEKPCLYEIPYDKSYPANRLVPDREETLTLEKESRSKLNKDKVRPYDYTKLNSLYEIFKPTTHEYHEQLAHVNETNNINHFRELVYQAWEKHSHDHFHAPTTHDMEILIRTCLMPLAIKTQNDSFTFVHELKQEIIRKYAFLT